MSQINTSARIIWSTEPKDFSADQVSLIQETGVDALRIGYTPDSEKEVLSFIEKLSSEYKDISSMPSIMLDITPPSRGKVVGLEEAIEVESGKRIIIAKEGSSLECSFQVSTNSWDSLLNEGATVYLGYGDVIFKVLKLSGDSAEAQVENGGLIKPMAELHVPETRKKTITDFSKLDIEKF